MTPQFQMAGACLALLCLAPLTGCFQDQVSTVQTGKEFQVEESLLAVRKSIIAWQTNPKHGDLPLPDSLADFDTVQRELATAPNGMWMGYYYRFFKSADGGHYVLFAYPKQKGLSGERSYFVDDSSSVQSREYPDGFDHANWDYDSLVKEFQSKP